MRIGMTVLIGAIVALVVRAVYQRNEMSRWERWMKSFRRLVSMMMGRRMMRRLWIG